MVITSSQVTSDDNLGKPCSVVIESNSSMWDAADAAKVRSKGYTTGLSDTFIRACKNMGLMFEHHDIYRKWLIENGKNVYGGKITETHVPIQKNKHGIVERLPSGWRLPYPSGIRWHKLKAQTGES